MIILGIDPGVATIGFGVIRAERGKNTLLRYGVITTPLMHVRVLTESGSETPSAASARPRLVRVR